MKRQPRQAWTLPSQLKSSLPLAAGGTSGSEMKHLGHQEPIILLAAAIGSCFADVLSVF